jgi:hypothetical protein
MRPVEYCLLCRTPNTAAISQSQDQVGCLSCILPYQYMRRAVACRRQYTTLVISYTFATSERPARDLHH